MFLTDAGFSQKTLPVFMEPISPWKSLRVVLKRLFARITELDGALSQSSNGNHVVARLIGLSSPYIYVCPSEATV